jgi:hypothetical protein
VLHSFPTRRSSDLAAAGTAAGAAAGAGAFWLQPRRTSDSPAAQARLAFFMTLRSTALPLPIDCRCVQSTIFQPCRMLSLCTAPVMGVPYRIMGPQVVTSGWIQYSAMHIFVRPIWKSHGQNQRCEPGGLGPFRRLWPVRRLPVLQQSGRCRAGRSGRPADTRGIPARRCGALERGSAAHPCDDRPALS